MTITIFNYPEFTNKNALLSQAINETISAGVKTTLFQNMDIRKASKIGWLLKSTNQCDLIFIVKEPTTFTNIGTEVIIFQIPVGGGSIRTSLFDFAATHCDVKIQNTSAGDITIDLWMIGKEMN